MQVLNTSIVVGLENMLTSPFPISRMLEDQATLSKDMLIDRAIETIILFIDLKLNSFWPLVVQSETLFTQQVG